MAENGTIKRGKGFVLARKQLFDSQENISNDTVCTSPTPSKDKEKPRNRTEFNTTSVSRRSFRERLGLFQQPEVKPKPEEEDESALKSKITVFEKLKSPKLKSRSGKIQKLLGKTHVSEAPRPAWSKKVQPNEPVKKWKSASVIETDALSQEPIETKKDEEHQANSNGQEATPGEKNEANSDKSKPHWTLRFSQRLNFIRQRLENRCAAERSKNVQNQLKIKLAPKSNLGGTHKSNKGPSDLPPTGRSGRASALERKELSKSCDDLNGNEDDYTTENGVCRMPSGSCDIYKKKNVTRGNSSSNSSIFSNSELTDDGRPVSSNSSIYRAKEPVRKQFSDSELLALPDPEVSFYLPASDTTNNNNIIESCPSDSADTQNGTPSTTPTTRKINGKPLTPVPWRKKSVLTPVRFDSPQGVLQTAFEETKLTSGIYVSNTIM